LGEEHAPRFLLAALLVLGLVRGSGTSLMGTYMPIICMQDAFLAAAVVVFWAFQEWWMHKFLLHAPFKVNE
jgi:hypothetical protein